MGQPVLATVIVLAEHAPLELVHQNISNIYNQTHKNLDVIVAYFQRDDIQQLRDRWATTSYNIRWMEVPQGFELIFNPLKEALGDAVFYKSINPIFWMPRHIEHHLQLFKEDKGAEWSYSLIEYRNMDEQNSPLNTLGYRIDTKIKPEQVVMDEICHVKSLTPPWDKCLSNIQGRTAFYPGSVITFLQDKRCAIPKEITILQWQKTTPPQPPAIAPPKSNVNVSEEVIEVDGNLTVKCEYPTIMGSSQWIDYNNLIRSRFASIPATDIKRIAVKRTIGMGDVILVEPIIRALRKMYPNADVDLFVGETRGAKDIAELFASKPNIKPMIGLGENPLLQDYLYDQKGYDLRFDLDCAYESRKNVRYIDSYMEVIGVKDEVVEKDGMLEVVNPMPEAERVPQLTYTGERLIPEKYVSVALDGSGWPGKEWGNTNWISILNRIMNQKGLKLAFVSNTQFEEVKNKPSICINDKNDFSIMLNYLKYAEFHIGADNGPMHIAAAFGKPCFIVAGAALPLFTTPSPLVYSVSKPNLMCLHCKGRQFINDNGQGGFTFVARCENSNQFTCMKDLDIETVFSEFSKFTGKFNIQ